MLREAMGKERKKKREREERKGKRKKREKKRRANVRKFKISLSFLEYCLRLLHICILPPVLHYIISL